MVRFFHFYTTNFHFLFFNCDLTSTVNLILGGVEKQELTSILATALYLKSQFLIILCQCIDFWISIYTVFRAKDDPSSFGLLRQHHWLLSYWEAFWCTWLMQRGMAFKWWAFRSLPSPFVLSLHQISVYKKLFDPPIHPNHQISTEEFSLTMN